MDLATARSFGTSAILFVLALAFPSQIRAAQPTKIEGLIVGLSGNVIVVEYMQGAELAFLLDDSTKVSQVGGAFKVRRTDKSMAALIPGLKVKVEGNNNGSHQYVATKVTFSGDLEQAQIAAVANRQRHEEHTAELERQLKL